MFIFTGLNRPHVALMGVIWVDTVSPQLISTSFLTGKPLSFLMTLAFFLSFLLNFKKIKSPKAKLPLFFLAFLCVWMTMSTYQAHYPELAWYKYSIVIKTIILSSFIPFVLNTRDKIEFFIWVFVASVGFYIFVGGVKTLLGGGGYAVSIIQSSAINSGITETSTLSIMSVVTMALVIYLNKYSKAAQHYRVLKIYTLLLLFVSVFSVVGTFARSGLIAMAILAFSMFLMSKQKPRLVLLGVLGLGVMLPMLPSAWYDRMGTISEPGDDESALGRIVVWRWTLDYAAKHPYLGGGFYSYLDNAEQLHMYASGNEIFEPNPTGKAFHNMFFEVMGELGYMGLMIYLLFIGLSLSAYWRLTKERDNQEWFDYLAKMIFVATLIYIVGGMFVGIAYSPWIFYLLLLGVSLSNLTKSERQRT
jgi:putative inorganic carbon (HCO3(-)) transporter